MANIISVTFNECTPDPENGYNVQWRVLGSAGSYIDAGNFSGSPATFMDDTNPDGTDYEGIVRADCGDGVFGEDDTWTAVNQSPTTTTTSTSTTTTTTTEAPTTTTTTSTTETTTSSTTTTTTSLSPGIACGDQSQFDGGVSFPTITPVTLGTDTGTVTLDFDAFSIPDKFIVKFDNVEVINTGYRGDAGYQSDLDAELAARGMPPEPIGSPSFGSISFSKGTATTIAYVYVWAPLPATQWQFTLNCPDPTPTTTTTTTTAAPTFPVSVRLSNVLLIHCSASPVTVYTDNGTITTGQNVYTDPEHTTLLLGWNFISDVSVGDIYSIDSGAGVVEADTGNNC